MKESSSLGLGGRQADIPKLREPSLSSEEGQYIILCDWAVKTPIKINDRFQKAKKLNKKRTQHKLDRAQTCNVCKDRCLQQLSAELSGGALPFQRRVWRRPSLICASSSREYTQSRPKSIKTCKWSPQIVYIINFIHNSQEKYGSFQYKLAKQTRRDALQPRHSRLGDNLSSVARPVWHQRNWENIEWRMGSEETVGKRRESREARRGT